MKLMASLVLLAAMFGSVKASASSELCVIYDYSQMISRQEPASVFYAIEAVNGNGGEFVAQYERSKFATKGEAEKAMGEDMKHLSSRCRAFATFIPTMQSPDAPAE